MATKFIGNLPAVQGLITNGGLLTLDVPVGPRYHTIWLTASTATNAYTSGNTPAIGDLISEVRVKVNGRVQRQYTGRELNLIQGILGEKFFCAKGEPTGTQASTTGGVCGYFGLDGNLRKLADNSLLTYSAAGGVTAYIPIFFAEPWRKSLDAQEAFAWPTTWPDGKLYVTSFQIDIICGAKLALITARAEYDLVQGVLDASGNPVMPISSAEKFVTPYTGSGDLSISQLPLVGSYQSIFLMASNGTITKVILKVNDRIVREVTAQEAWNVLMARDSNLQGYDPSVIPIIFDYDDLPSSALSMQGVTAMEIRPTLNVSSGSGNLTILYERFGGLL